MPRGHGAPGRGPDASLPAGRHGLEKGLAVITDRRTFLGVGLAGTAIATDARPQSAGQADGGDAIDRFILKRMDAKGIPGAAVAVVRDGVIVKQAGYGKISVELDRPATERSVFPMASASKMFAGLVAGVLHDQGKLDLDASLLAYLPELPAAFESVRIWNLLSHTSGLADPGANPAYVAELADREGREAYVDDLRLELFTASELMAYASVVPPVSPAGTDWRYSQYPYFLFGQIVERLTGSRYAAFLDAAVFGPLGMTQTTAGDHRTVVTGRTSTNYTRQFGPFQNYALRYMPGYLPAAGLNTSAADMTRLFAAFDPGRLVSGEVLERLWRPVRLADERVVQYGLGFDLSSIEDGRSAGHEGGGCCYVRWWPGQRLGIAVLLNLSGSREDGIEHRLAKLILGT